MVAGEPPAFGLPTSSLSLSQPSGHLFPFSSLPQDFLLLFFPVTPSARSSFFLGDLGKYNPGSARMGRSGRALSAEPVRQAGLSPSPDSQRIFYTSTLLKKCLSPYLTPALCVQTTEEEKGKGETHPAT